MTKLNQIVAIEKSVKAAADKEWTKTYHDIQKAALFSGISRTYDPKDDEGDQLPPEHQSVQMRADGVITNLIVTLTRMFDVIATKDAANCGARADIKVGDDVVATNVPITTLLFLEKQLVDLATFITKLPVLDPAEQWSYDPAVDGYTTPPVKTTRSKKIPRNWVKAEATTQHPAQVEVYHEDVLVGYWTTKKLSGALPAEQVAEYALRVRALANSVKFAREEANGMEVTDARIGLDVLNFIFA